MSAKWRCTGCGYIHDGDAAPEVCPKCGAPASAFEQLDEAAANLIERSRRTNMLHGQLVAACRDIEGVCKAGLEDALDPGCVDVFEKALQSAYVVMKMSMAEMQIHMKKGKWS